MALANRISNLAHAPKRFVESQKREMKQQLAFSDFVRTSEKGQPQSKRQVAEKAFRLLEEGRTPQVSLDYNAHWSISERAATMTVSAGELEVLKNYMIIAATDSAYGNARLNGKEMLGAMGRLELALTKWEIGRFVKEIARA